MSIQRDNSAWGKTRDRVAWAVANFALNHIATPWYRTMILGLINYGMIASHEEE